MATKASCEMCYFSRQKKTYAINFDQDHILCGPSVGLKYTYPKKKLTFKYFDILNERDEHTKQDVKRMREKEKKITRKEMKAKNQSIVIVIK